MAFESSNPTLEVLQDIRRKNMGDSVPEDYKKRNDFVKKTEMEEACTQIGARYGIDLSDFYQNYSLKATNCKSIFNAPAYLHSYRALATVNRNHRFLSFGRWLGRLIWYRWVRRPDCRTIIVSTNR